MVNTTKTTYNNCVPGVPRGGGVGGEKPGSAISVDTLRGRTKRRPSTLMLWENEHIQST